MVNDERIRQAADHLAAAYRAEAPLALLDEPFAPRSIAEAYAVQDAFLARLADVGGSVAGYKIAYTNPAMRGRAGVSGPVAGGMLERTVQRSPATVSAADFDGLAVECEVGVRLGSALGPGGAPYSRDTIEGAVAALMTSFELVDARRSMQAEGDMREIAAAVTGVRNAGAVLGAEVADWRGIDLAGARGTLHVNGELRGEGRGSAVMGHPLEPVAWLANLLAERGLELPGGSIVLTGSLVTPTPVSAGDVVRIAVDGLGEATLEVT